MSKPLGLIELITRIGEDSILIQNLVESATNFQARGKRGVDTAITFLTDRMTPDEVFSKNPRYIALVLWLPAEKVTAARAAHEAEQP
jgi:hypothetical protein